MCVCVCVTVRNINAQVRPVLFLDSIKTATERCQLIIFASVCLSLSYTFFFVSSPVCLDVFMICKVCSNPPLRNNNNCLSLNWTARRANSRGRLAFWLSLSCEILVEPWLFLLFLDWRRMVVCLNLDKSSAAIKGRGNWRLLKEVI